MSFDENKERKHKKIIKIFGCLHDSASFVNYFCNLNSYKNEN